MNAKIWFHDWSPQDVYCRNAEGKRAESSKQQVWGFHVITCSCRNFELPNACRSMQWHWHNSREESRPIESEGELKANFPTLLDGFNHRGGQRQPPRSGEGSFPPPNLNPVEGGEEMMGQEVNHLPRSTQPQPCSCSEDVDIAGQSSASDSNVQISLGDLVLMEPLSILGEVAFMPFPAGGGQPCHLCDINANFHLSAWGCCCPGPAPGWQSTICRLSLGETATGLF